MNAPLPLSDSEREELDRLRGIVMHMERLWDACRQETLDDVIEELVGLNWDSPLEIAVITRCINTVKKMK